METIAEEQKIDYKIIGEAKKAFFESGGTRAYQFRKSQLKKLKNVIAENEGSIMAALKQDLHKPAFESFTSEISLLYAEIDDALKNLKKWMKPKSVSTPIIHFPTSSKVYSDPLGVVLIIGPWNYPFQLLMAPVVAAIAAGNCAVLKPSEETPATSTLIRQLIEQNFESNYLSVVEGEGAEVVPAAVNAFRYDHIFFTGSVPVGQKIYEMAAKKLIPVTLELGGKSPTIVDATADLKVSARRIAWSKFFNAGQTCVSPDYLLIEESVKSAFIDEFKNAVVDFYGEDPKQSPDLARIVNAKRMTALKQYLQEGEIIMGGQVDDDNLFVAPTLLDNVSFNDKVMQEEIFGPILPIVTFRHADDIKKVIAKNPYPLSLYLYTKDKKLEKMVINEIQFGGGAINNGLIHLSNANLPFGGIGYSGIGSYHGKSGFMAFSHQKSISKTRFFYDNKVKYPAYNDWKIKFVMKFF